MDNTCCVSNCSNFRYSVTRDFGAYVVTVSPTLEMLGGVCGAQEVSHYQQNKVRQVYSIVTCMPISLYILAGGGGVF